MPQLWLEPLVASGPGDDLLSPDERRWGSALPEPRRLQYWSSRALLRRRVARLLGCQPAELPLQAPPGRPPRLADGAGWLGLSHSGAGVLIAWSPSPIGVDLECADRPLRARLLVGRFFPRLECQQLEGVADTRLNEAVLRSWVLKEAAIKWRCRTLAQELTSWRFDHHSGDLHLSGEGLCPPWRGGLIGPWRWAAVGTGVERLTFHPAAASFCQKTNQSC